MNCHRFVPATQNAQRIEEQAAKSESRAMRPIVSPEIRKIYDAMGLDESAPADSSRAPRAIVWTRVHNLPDFVYFDHSRHVNGGIECRTCHGPVETMERIRQVGDLTMGFCVNCHRQENVKVRQTAPVRTSVTVSSGREGAHTARDRASIDCATCHF